MRKITNKNYWDHYYYQAADLVGQPSNYAKICSVEWTSPLKIIEVGCGNGRDAFHFAHLGHDVIGLDISDSAIQLCKKKYKYGRVEFIVGTLQQYLSTNISRQVDVVYSRFSLHAMDKHEESETLMAGYYLLKNGGRLYLECRSINDPMAQFGEKISEDERVHGHYRRFIRIERLTNTLEKLGFRVLDAAELSGVTPLGHDDPVVIRLTATKID
jgi:bifunctional enzyme CysN/CysC